jgi:hypothetical protein
VFLEHPAQLIGRPRLAISAFNHFSTAC